jgi:hypothetical protein
MNQEHPSLLERKLSLLETIAEAADGKSTWEART